MRGLLLVLLFVNIFAFNKEVKNADIINSYCNVCGMSLKKYYKTYYRVILKNNKKKEYCSLHCLVVDNPKNVKKILAVDAKTDKLIDATKAYYVVGSKIEGTMSRISKFAFQTLDEAKEFQKIYGGKIVDFKKALEITKNSLKRDALYLQPKRKKMKKIGEIAYKRACKKVDVFRFKNPSELKIYLSKVCKVKKDKLLQAITIYLWSKKFDTFKITKKDKCPVCGMFVYKYPNWVAIITYDKGYLAFDGVKDMMKFYFNPSKYGYKNINIKNMLVTDYYTLSKITAKMAYFVIKSNVYGPMGKEFIPFSSYKEAENFIIDHGGEIITFNKITPLLIKSLDEN